MPKLKHITLVLILIGGAWALWPRPGDPLHTRLFARPAATDDDSAEAARQVRYILRIAPGSLYMPGTMPMNVGRPLEGFNKVARDFEALFPDTRIEFVGVPEGNREWLVTQLMSGKAPDILMVNVEDVWQDVQKGWYLPLDGYLEQPNPFVEPDAPGSGQWWNVFKYQAITRGKAAPDGRMYCISLDMIETGIIYNKDLFRKLGVQPPKDWIEFLEIQRKFRDAGYIPLLLTGGNIADWGVDLIFDQLYYDLLPLIDLRQDPVREQYMQGYLDWDEISFLYEQGFFTRHDPRYVELWRLLKEWREFFPPDLATIDVMRTFVTQRAAMFWTASPTVNLLARDPDIAFDWGIFYLPPIPPQHTPYAAGHEMCVIGGAGYQYVVTNSAFRDTGDPGTSERVQRAIAFLQFLTTPKQTDRVVNEVIALLPNVHGVDPHPHLMPFHEFLQRRYTTTKWQFTFDLRFNEIMQRMLLLYLNDGISEEDFLNWMENNMNAAVQTAARRQNPDLERLQRVWDERTHLRAQFKGLPDAEE